MKLIKKSKNFAINGEEQKALLRQLLLQSSITNAKTTNQDRRP